MLACNHQSAFQLACIVANCEPKWPAKANKGHQSQKCMGAKQAQRPAFELKQLSSLSSSSSSPPSPASALVPS
eukprot:6707791-Karenia_brevis.AAC.1